jgi:hypothetical protein
MVDRKGKTLKQVASFKYLGSGISEKRGCEIVIRERITAAWVKWRGLTGVICDKRMPLKLKAKLYRTVVRPVLLYGIETMALKELM